MSDLYVYFYLDILWIKKLKILKPNVKLLFKDTMNYIYSNNILLIVFCS